MADTPVLYRRNDLAKPTIKVKKLWLEQQIAEKKARVERLKTDAFELIEGRIKGIQADIIMGERDIMELMQDLDDLEHRDDAEIIDVK